MHYYLQHKQIFEYCTGKEKQSFSHNNFDIFLFFLLPNNPLLLKNIFKYQHQLCSTLITSTCTFQHHCIKILTTQGDNNDFRCTYNLFTSFCIKPVIFLVKNKFFTNSECQSISCQAVTLQGICSIIHFTNQTPVLQNFLNPLLKQATGCFIETVKNQLFIIWIRKQPLS